MNLRTITRFNALSIIIINKETCEKVDKIKYLDITLYKIE